MYFEYSKVNHRSMGPSNILSRYSSDYFPNLGAVCVGVCAWICYAFTLLLNILTIFHKSIQKIIRVTSKIH